MNRAGSKQLRIGVNALYLIPGEVGGTEIYLRNLLVALAKIDTTNEYLIITNEGTGTDLVPVAPNFRLLRHSVKASFRPARILWEQAVLPFTAVRHKLDVMFNPGFTAPLLAMCPQVTTIHDLQHKRHPEFFKPMDLVFWRLLVWAAIRKSKLLLTPSESTRHDILYYFQKDAVITPYGVDQRLFDLAAERTGAQPQPYLLCVSTLHPHKNIELLVRAFVKYRGVHPEMSLILAGMRGFHTEVIVRVIGELGLRQSVQITGWIPRDELYELYRGAHAFVFPSMFEGFGIPLVEALAAGIPSVCANVEPMISNAAGAALTFDPASVDGLTDCLLRITEDEGLRAELSEAGRVQASQFRWERTATLTLKALTEAAGSTQ